MDSMKITSFIKRPLLGIEKTVINFDYIHDISIRVTVHCIDGNITIKAFTENGSYNMYFVHVELDSISSIKLERKVDITKGDGDYDYHNVFVTITYTLEDGNTKLVSINKNGFVDISSDFECLIENRLRECKHIISNKSQLKYITGYPKDIISEIRGRTITFADNFEYTMPRELYYDISRLLNPGDIAIENKCGSVQLRCIIFGLLFNFMFNKKDVKVCISNKSGSYRNVGWQIGDFEYLSNDGEYHNFSYKFMPNSSCINNTRNAFGLVVAAANYAISLLVVVK